MTAGGQRGKLREGREKYGNQTGDETCVPCQYEKEGEMKMKHGIAAVAHSQWEIFRKLVGTAVCLECPNGDYGTGICLAPGLVITANHVVADSETAIARTIKLQRRTNSLQLSRERTVATVIYRDTAIDIALVRLETLPDRLRPATVAKRATDLSEREVFRIGLSECPLGSGHLLEMRHNGRTVQLAASIPVHCGDSGGGLFNAEGELIGIALIRSVRKEDGPTICLAVPVRTALRRFRRRSGQKQKDLLRLP